MKVVCDWCNPPRVMFEKAPLDDPTEIGTICPSCYATMMQLEGKVPVKVPDNLGQACHITEVEHKGPIHVTCNEKAWKITVEGEVTEEPFDVRIDQQPQV